MTGPTRTVRARVIWRDKSMCQWCGHHVDVSTGDYSLQHRRARGMGGSRLPDTNLTSNLVLVCGSATTGCHGHIESHRVEAIGRGFNVPQGTLRRPSVPADVPLRDWRGEWWRLDDDGNREPVHPIDAVEFMTLIGSIKVKELT